MNWGRLRLEKRHKLVSDIYACIKRFWCDRWLCIVKVLMRMTSTLKDHLCSSLKYSSKVYVHLCVGVECTTESKMPLLNHINHRNNKHSHDSISPRTSYRALYIYRIVTDKSPHIKESWQLDGISRWQRFLKWELTMVNLKTLAAAHHWWWLVDDLKCL